MTMKNWGQIPHLLFVSCYCNILFSVADGFVIPARVPLVTPLRATSTADDTGQLRVGFIGCGTIASAIATGLATQTQIPLDSIAVTKRSEAKSQKLADAFPSLITRHDKGQEIVDQSDVIFVCVLPQQTSEVLQNLNFDSEKHTLVSLVVSIRPGFEIIDPFSMHAHIFLLTEICVFAYIVHCEDRGIGKRF